MTDASILVGGRSGTNESAGTLHVAAATVPPLWLARLDQTRVSGTDFRAPSDDERAVMREAMRGLLRGELDAARRKLALVGFVLESLSDDVVLVREHENHRRGGGAFLVRQRGAVAPRLCIQASHSLDDEHTLPIALELFMRSSACALFTNTAHCHPADVAHTTPNLFHAATEGFVRAFAGAAVVVQILGFDEARHRGAYALLSSGSRVAPGSIVERAARALGAVLGDVHRSLVRIAPTRPRGSFANVQGVLMQELGCALVHVELSAKLRRILVDDRLVRELVTSALAAGITGAPIAEGVL